MSTGGQIAGGVVGGVIGAVVGGPTGAIYGAQIGIMAGGLLDPPKGPTVEGPRLGDLTVQTSTYGQFIPRTYGTIGLSGNVFWLENNKIKEVVRKKKSGGKGGGSSSTVKTYTYFATFAVGLCEGPIAGVRRIWVGPDLVYDAGSDDLETIISSNQASAKFTIYTGTDTQQPDPRIQAEIGVADCPAFRGLAYIVVKDLKLTNYGNSVAGAQVKVEVVNSALNPLQVVKSELSDTYSNRVAPGVALTGEMLSYMVYENAYGAVLSKIANGAVVVDKQLPSTSGSIVVPVSASLKYSVFAFNSNNLSGFTTSTLIWGDDALDKRHTLPVGGSPLSIIEDEDCCFCVYTPYGGGSNKLRRITGPDTGAWSLTHEITVAGSPVIFSSAGVLYCLSRSLSSAVTVERYASDTLAFISSGSFTLSSTGSITAGDNAAVNYVENAVVSYGNPVSGFSFFIYDPALNQSISEQYIDTAFVKNSPASPCMNAIGSVVGVSQFGGAGASQLVQFIAFNFGVVSPETVPLSGIFSTEAQRSMLIAPADIDSSGLTDSVTGFKVTATGSIRNAIEPLRGAWPFDVVQAGYKIKATSRGSASVVTIPIGELAIDTQLTESREMDSQLPQNVTVKYIDRERDYDANEQRAQRDNTEAVNSLVLELPVVLSATQSAQVADKLIRIYALEKSDFSFTLPAPYRYLEPGDVVTIAATDADYVLRLVSVNQTADGRLECAGRPSSAATYTSIAPGDGGKQGAVTIPLAGATVVLIVDCPVIDDGLQDAPGFAVGMNGYSAGWPGGILYRTADNGQTWDDLQAFTGRANAGFASTALTASAGNLIQRGGSLTVSLIGGMLESVTEAQMLNGANIAAYGINGSWEIIRFQNATLNVDGTYTLDTFWRGDKGTEWATGLHAANDTFVLMTDPDLEFVGMPTDSIGQPRDYRAVTAGADIDSAASQAFTYSAVNLETLSGVHPRGSRSAGDLTITWQRRTRVGGAWRDYVDASLGEASESYEVDIMDGPTVKRTITATTPSVLYTSAMQVTDFGSPQASVTVNIYQLSAVVGRGYKLEATL